MQSKQTLRRYWIRFDPKSQVATGFRLGCGVTALSEFDAVSLLRSIYPAAAPTFTIEEIISDVSMSQLDQNHVIPNIGDVERRGVWFPDFGYRTTQ